MRFFGKPIEALTVVFVYFSARSISAEIDSPQVEIEVIPDTIKLAPHVEARALVIIRNNNDTLLKNVRLSWLSDSTSKLSPESTESKNLVSVDELV